MQTEAIKQIFVKRYVFAISLIFLLATSTFIILSMALKQSESTALIVNVSGKQRMLSQRIASLAQQYYWNTFVRKDSEQSATTQQALVSSINEMRSANNALSSGRLNSKFHVELSDEIYELYFGPTKLKMRVDEYLNTAEYLLQIEQDSDEEITTLQALVNESGNLLPDLNSAVLQYQKEGDEKIDDINRLEWMAFALTILVLMLEVIFIFQPMADKVHQLFQEIIWHKNSLEQQVALRTLHLEQANLKLERMASHDPLTGLRNRLYLERDLEDIQKHYREHGLPYAVAMFDIDWFKMINDTYGHDAGDFVLKELASLFHENLRTQDTVYRSGGEEFVVLLNRISLDQAYEKLDTLRQIIEKHQFTYTDITLHCTISGGIYHSDMDGDINGHQLLKLVDEALYQAKTSGRNRMIKAVQ